MLKSNFFFGHLIQNLIIANPWVVFSVKTNFIFCFFLLISIIFPIPAFNCISIHMMIMTK